MDKLRNRNIDIMKGITIILMVVGHSGCSAKKFIYLFHMSVFFMISGWLFKIDYEKGMREVCKYIYKKVKHIWLPYFIWNAIFTLLTNVFIKINVYSGHSFKIFSEDVTLHTYMSLKEMIVNIVKGIFMIGRTELGGAFWFLRTLFAISIIFVLVGYVLHFIKNNVLRELIHFSFSVILLMIGYVANINGIKTLSVLVVLSSYILFYIGYIIKKLDIMNHINNYLLIICGVIVLCVCYLGPEISLGDNDYTNPLYLIICALAGWALIYGISNVLASFKWTNVFSTIGKYTLPIVILHFLCFKIVTLVQITVYDYPMAYLAAFPVIKTNGLWWILYTCVGVVLPVIFQILYDKCKKKVK